MPVSSAINCLAAVHGVPLVRPPALFSQDIDRSIGFAVVVVRVKRTYADGGGGVKSTHAYGEGVKFSRYFPFVLNGWPLRMLTMGTRCVSFDNLCHSCILVITCTFKLLC